MPIHAVCPECEASYNLPDQQEGRRVRCKQCQSVFTVAAAPVASSRAVTGSKSGRAKDSASRAGSASKSGASKSSATGKVMRRDEEPDEPAQGTGRPASRLPLVIGAVVACVALVAAGAITVVLTRKSPSERRTSSSDSTASVNFTPAPLPPPVAVQPNLPASNPITRAINSSSPHPAPPTAEKTVAPATPAPPPATATLETSRPSGDGHMSAETRAKVKRATVYIHVTYADGRQVSGSGFFGVPDSPNLVLTNAHVIGMLAPESRRPQKIEVTLNSGEANAKKTSAGVLGVDRHTDLAVLDLGTSDGMPTPLTVKPAAGLQELDPVYIFGFPLGKTLGEEITIRPSTVSSLRKHNGVLEKVQVSGGMDPGNSGGPVVNASGDVVGVAVSGFEGRLINFAIPGERVSDILRGRALTLVVGQPVLTPGGVKLPVSVEMIDPRGRVKSAAVEVWTGPRGNEIPPSTKEPAQRPGESTRQHVEIPYGSGKAEGEISLPDLPAGKVYWLQPVFVAENETRWGNGAPYVNVRPELAVERKPARIQFRQGVGSTRRVVLQWKSSLRGGGSGDDDDAGVTLGTDVLFQERVAAVNAEATTLHLEYKGVKREMVMNKERKQDPQKELIDNNLSRLVALMRIDSTGNPIQNELDNNRLYNSALAVAPGSNQRIVKRSTFGVVVITDGEDPSSKLLRAFHDPIKDALDAMAIPMPEEDHCSPGAAWSGKRTMPLVDTRVFGGEKYESAQLQLSCTYMGQRTRDGKPEAVLALDGVVRGKDDNDSAGGHATGTAVIDLTTGLATHADLRCTVEIEADIGRRSGRLMVTSVVRLDRTMQ